MTEKNFDRCFCFADGFHELDDYITSAVDDLARFFVSEGLCIEAAKYFADNFYARLQHAILTAENVRKQLDTPLPSPAQFTEYMQSRDLRQAIQHVNLLMQEVEGRG